MFVLHCITFQTFHIEFDNMHASNLFTYYPANLYDEYSQ